MIEFFHAHSYWFGIASLWLFSAAISNMPEPDSSSSKGYRWLYGTLHSLAANFQQVSTSIKPPLK